MARKRLTAANPMFLDETPAEIKSSPGGGLSPPIAQVAGSAAEAAALDELTAELSAMRADGRLLMDIPLSQVDMAYMIRDRMVVDADDLEELRTSLLARGQRSAVELVRLDADGQVRYGLVSGWRRMMALKSLYAETKDERFSVVRAIVRDPETARGAYISMVEENEIRIGLSFFERAHLVAEAVRAGIFETDKQALLNLFANVSRAKRSKIRSFTILVRTIGPDLRFPGAISERLGLQLVMGMRLDPDLQTRIQHELQQAQADTAEQELAILQKAAEAATRPKPEKVSRAKPLQEVLSDGTSLTLKGEGRTARIEIKGARVSGEMLQTLKHLLSQS